MAPDATLLDPQLYRNTRRPLLETETLPRHCYTAEAFYRREIETIFLKVGNYYRRLDISIAEDNEISYQQQIGLSSPFCLPGRFSHMEPLVHVIDNWVLDRVVGAA